ncbi:G-protein coupled receptor Mth2-like isoform X2 [Sitophilus oryzae]|uniref:G-protein coupled receptor Mth2-like isoform X2 n=1 Tax=Sitophilus oryzae TaxID=7048 RepID=A0A6J2Y0P5_SITOR|nr:G-protein coupled receptor Mth2-like isoform X2 [Sitophilus oryzae]
MAMVLPPHLPPWFFIIINLILTVSSLENCDVKIDISSGTISENGENRDIVYDGTTFKYGQDYFINETGTFGCACHVLSCVHECCDSGQVVDVSSGSIQCVTAKTSTTKAKLFHIIQVPDRPVCEKQTIVLNFTKEEFTSMISDKDHIEIDSYSIHYDSYCITTEEDTIVLVACISSTGSIDKTIHCLGMIISMPFLLMTFLVYLVLPEKNVHQVALMFYVLHLLLAYVCLVTINLSPHLDFCHAAAYMTLFFFVVSFFWMNVICFDIWYTFSGGRGYGSKKSSEKRKLILYTLYAEGLPLLHLLVVYLMDRYMDTDSIHKPNIGVTKCFLADGFPNLWYFYGEASISVIANIVFFIFTALKIRQVKKETSMLKQNESKRHTFEKEQQRFNLYLKLLLAMGVNWSMEIISWLVNWLTNEQYSYIWYITDFVNAAYGVIIFFIFVFKKKMWKLLQKRYYNLMGKPHLARAVTSTTDTRTSHYSSTNYSSADTHLTDRTTINDRTSAINRNNRNEEIPLHRS